MDKNNLTALIDQIKGYRLSEHESEHDDNFYIQLASEIGGEEFSANFRLSTLLGNEYKFEPANNELYSSLFVIVRAGSSIQQRCQQASKDTQKNLSGTEISAILANHCGDYYSDHRFIREEQCTGVSGNPNSRDSASSTNTAGGILRKMVEFGRNIIQPNDDKHFWHE